MRYFSNTGFKYILFCLIVIITFFFYIGKNITIIFAKVCLAKFVLGEDYLSFVSETRMLYRISKRLLVFSI